jgi:deoxyribodipyrimidine photolyase-related protein
MNSIFIIFPNQLYEDVSFIKQIKTNAVYLIEEPVYFYDQDYKPYKPHKIKIAFLRASMKSYFDNNLKKQISKKVQLKYIEYNEIVKNKYDFLQHFQEVIYYNPIDVELDKKLQNIFAKHKYLKPKVLDSPDLLLPRQITDEFYRSKQPKHASFYEFVKQELNILDGIKNLDSMNRSSPPLNPPNVYHFENSKNTEKYYKEAINYVHTHFQDNFGECELLRTFPITSNDAKISFERFLHQSLGNFGKFEDAVMIEDPFMYHSVISPMLNNGLLTPSFIIKRTLEFYSANKQKIPLSSLEGFIRQVIGWRFFMQTLYINKHNELVKSNIPNNKLTFRKASDWYNGTTGILPIDEEIKKIKKYGYAHHIVRLMVLMNFFILCNVHPQEIYRWFMEVVSMDAYSWVMISNIYAMGYFYPRIMSKPYISSSNYILKMTNYKKDGYWNIIWDALYHKFLKDKPTSYTFFYKRTYKNDKNMHKLADAFIDKHFIPYNKEQ